MKSLADKAILLGADNRPPMLEKYMYDSWKSRMELYMLNRQHGWMILESVENGPLLWPTVEENGVTRLKKYSELSTTEAIQADCDVKATNIILQGLPPEVYALVSTHKVAKELWERIQMLMQGTSLAKQERECKLYDEFDKFAYRKRESLRDFYLRFSFLLNDMNIYNMKLEQFQVNTKFLNTFPPEWSKFVTDVKLVRDLHTTNVDQLHAYLGQYEYHANEVRETLMLEDESRSKMLKKQNDPIMSEKKIITKPVDYAALNQLLKDFETRFVPQTELSAEQPFWSWYLVHSEEPNLSSRTTIVEVPKELPKVSMVNSSLKKLKFHLGSFDVVVKERTTAIAITARGDIEQHCVEKNKFQDKMKNVLKDNERLLEQAISVDIVNIVVHDHVNSACKSVNVCERCVTIETELQKNFIKKECYDTLFKKYNTLEKHFISMEVENKLKKETFQRNNSFSKQSAPTFDQLFEINDLKARSQEKDTVIMKLKERLKSLSERLKSLSGNVKEEKIKRELEEIETINIELDHRVTKLVAENEHLKQTYKQLYDSIKSLCVRSKEQCDDLIKQVNIKSAKIFDLNASLQEKVLVITALKETLSKLKGKPIVTEAVTLHLIDPELLKIDVAPLAPKLCNNKIAHTDYLRHTQEETATLREIVESARLLNPLNASLDYACKYTKRIQEFLIILQQTCPCITDLETKLMAVTPKNNDKKIRFTEHIPLSGNTLAKTTSSISVVQIVLWYLDSGCSKHMIGDRSQLINCVQKFFGMVKFENDHVAKIMGYGDYKIGNVTISRVYFVEALGHNLFSVG
nr:retrovirus-related Pol polyprotein from transposon TNT 1-94 [Tanacetum cinerariifolium]